MSNQPLTKNDASSAGTEFMRHVSPWTTREKIGRVLWGFVESTLFRFSPQPCYAWRGWLLRLFGAKLDRHVFVRATVHIEVPWNLRIGEHSAVGDHAILYSLGMITIGRYVTVSQYAHLCAGTHDTTSRTMTLLREPITIGDDVWIAADAFVGPGVTVGDRTVVGARSSVFKDLPSGVVAVGNPAKPIKERKWRSDHSV